MVQSIDYESLEPKPTGAPWWQKPRPLLLAVLALVLAYAPAVVMGVGTSPCFLFLGAIFIAVVTDRLAQRSSRRLRTEILGLLGVLLISIVTSYWTSHPSADRMFKLAFGISPPAGVSRIEGRVQWFDGLNMVIHFSADDAAMQQLLASRPFQTDPHVEEMVKSGQFNLSFVSSMGIKHIVDRYWNSPITGNSGRRWRYRNSTATDSQVDDVDMFQNEKGEVWVICAKGG